MKILRADAEGKIQEEEIKLRNDKPNSRLIYQVIRAQQLSRRRGTAATKTRGLVSGGGRKPWRQKGTGRARIGSIRAPHWTGGGIVFGPQPKSWSKALPKKMRKRALVDALSARILDNDLIVIPEFGISNGKTKEAVALLGKLGVKGKTLIVTAARDDMVLRAFSNLDAKVREKENINTEDALWADKIIMDQASWGAIEGMVV